MGPMQMTEHELRTMAPSGSFWGVRSNIKGTRSISCVKPLCVYCSSFYFFTFFSQNDGMRACTYLPSCLKFCCNRRKEYFLNNRFLTAPKTKEKGTQIIRLKTLEGGGHRVVREKPQSKTQQPKKRAVLSEENGSP